MVRQFIGIVTLALLAGASSIADERADREKLIGSWQLHNQVAESPATGWLFTLKGSDLQVTQFDGEKQVSRFQCATEGSPCDIKTAGKKAMISMWYNGAKLVQMETRGSDVIKRRFGILPQGDVMEMEVIPIVPAGKTETFRFERVQVSARSK